MRPYPNPFSMELTIELQALANQETKIEIVSVTGQVVYSKAIDVKAGLNVITCNPVISDGVYLVKSQIDGREFVQKVIKQAASN
jgi:hypothetical protein